MKMKYLLCLLLISIFFSCCISNKRKEKALLSETMKLIHKDTGNFWLYYPTSPEDFYKGINKKVPRLNIVFSNAFEKEQAEMFIAFNSITKIDTINLEWKYILASDLVTVMNYDTIRTYHFIDTDTMPRGYQDELGRLGYFGILIFLMPIEIKTNNEAYYITGIRYNTISRIYIFKKLASGFKFIGHKSVGFGLLE